MSCSFLYDLHFMMHLKDVNGIMESENIKKSFLDLLNAYTCDGEDPSPEIEGGRVNIAISKCLFLLCNDPHADRRGNFVHRFAGNIGLANCIPENISKLPEPSCPVKAVRGNLRNLLTITPRYSMADHKWPIFCNPLAFRELYSTLM